MQAGIAAFDLETGAIFFSWMQSHRQSLCRGRKLCAKTIRLKLREISQVAATNAGRKTKEILNQGRRARLSSWRVTLEHDGLQTFRGSVNGSSQARGAGPHNRQVSPDFFFFSRRQRPQKTRYLSDFAKRGFAQWSAGGSNQS